MWGAYESTLKDVGNNCKVQWPFQIHGARYISIGDNFDAAKHLTLLAFDNYRKTNKEYTPFIEIGNNVTITEFCQISYIDYIKQTVCYWGGMYLLQIMVTELEIVTMKIFHQLKERLPQRVP